MTHCITAREPCHPTDTDFTTTPRLGDLSARAQETAQVAAALSARFNGRDLAAALGGHAASVVERVDELLCAGVLADDGAGHLRFASSELRDGALSLVPDEQRQRIRAEVLRSWSVAGTAATSELGDTALLLAGTTPVFDVESEAILITLVEALETTDPGRAGRIALLVTSQRGLRRKEYVDLHIHGLRLVGVSGRADEALAIASGARTPADSTLRRHIVRKAFTGAEWAPLEFRLQSSSDIGAAGER